MKKFIDILYRIERVVSILLFAMIILVSSLQIFSRLFGKPISWTEEFLRFGFVWLIFVVSSIVTNDQSHFKIDILYEHFNGIFQKILDVVINIFILIFCWIQTYYGGILMIVGNERISPTLHIPMSYIYMIIPITGLLSMIHVLCHIIERGKDE